MDSQSKKVEKILQQPVCPTGRHSTRNPFSVRGSVSVGIFQGTGNGMHDLAIRGGTVDGTVTDARPGRLIRGKTSHG
jgi:hypothetical protein